MRQTEIRKCKVCPNTFRCKTTRKKLTCCTRCSLAYSDIWRKSSKYLKYQRDYKRRKNETKSSC
jgi:hypothetical protein